MPVSDVSFPKVRTHVAHTNKDYQKTVGNMALYGYQTLRDKITGRKNRVNILNSIDGVVDAGEMLVVLGPPGSGCTTLLKAIAGEMNGIYLDESSHLNYRGKFKLWVAGGGAGVAPPYMPDTN